MNDSKRVAITGIDGAGKSTITRHLINHLTGTAHRGLVMTCPRFHETSNAPLADLSRQLDALSRIADDLGSFALKAVAQFIQTTLYGQVETFLRETFQPTLLISERHPLIDMFAYGRLYVHLVEEPLDRKALETPVRTRLDTLHPGAYNSVADWVRLVGTRVQRDLTFWELNTYLRELFSSDKKQMMHDFEQITQATLPDIIIFLEAGARLATTRVGDREENHTELHERQDMLETIRHGYQMIMNYLSRNAPGTEIRNVSMDDTTSIEETLRAVLESIKFAS